MSNCKCNVPAKTVQTKNGPNTGKWFYACNRAKEDPYNCKFFAWAPAPPAQPQQQGPPAQPVYNYAPPQQQQTFGQKRPYPEDTFGSVSYYPAPQEEQPQPPSPLSNQQAQINEIKDEETKARLMALSLVKVQLDTLNKFNGYLDNLNLSVQQLAEKVEGLEQLIRGKVSENSFGL